jgi:hypothetical protein
MLERIDDTKHLKRNNERRGQVEEIGSGRASERGCKRDHEDDAGATS